MRGKVYLLIISLLLIGIFFTLPRYHTWLFDFILNPPISYKDQFDNIEPEQRRVLRYGNTYEVYGMLKNSFERIHVAHPVILLPPPGYLQYMGITGVDMGNPPAFYYFTGYRGVFAGSPDVELAQWAILPNKKGVMLSRIDSKEQRNYLIQRYNQYQSSK